MHSHLHLHFGLKTFLSLCNAQGQPGASAAPPPPQFAAPPPGGPSRGPGTAALCLSILYLFPFSRAAPLRPARKPSLFMPCRAATCTPSSPSPDSLHPKPDPLGSSPFQALLHTTRLPAALRLSACPLCRQAPIRALFRSVSRLLNTRAPADPATAPGSPVCARPVAPQRNP